MFIYSRVILCTSSVRNNSGVLVSNKYFWQSSFGNKNASNCFRRKTNPCNICILSCTLFYWDVLLLPGRSETLARFKNRYSIVILIIKRSKLTGNFYYNFIQRRVKKCKVSLQTSWRVIKKPCLENGIFFTDSNELWKFSILFEIGGLQSWN